MFRALVLRHLVRFQLDLQIQDIHLVDVLAYVQKGTYDFEKKTLELRSSLVGNASKVGGPSTIIGLWG